MTEFVHHQSLVELQAALEPIALPVERQPPHWISTPDGDHGDEWCGYCGYYKLRNLRRKDRKRATDYFLDGGWRTEEEGLYYCISCGVHLDVCLLPYGAYAELDYYSRNGFSTDVAEDAYCIEEVLNCLSCTDGSAEQEAAALESYFLAHELLSKT